MADLKISQLTSATLPLAGTEVLPIVQSSSTKKVATDDLTVKNVRSNATTGILQIAGPAAAATRTMTVPDANFTAARTDAAQSFTGDQTLSTGNLIQGTAAKGINFTANSAAAGKTSQLLNWYEEGTWTPTILFGGNGVGITYSTQAGYYTRIGRQVTLTCHIALSNKGSSTGSATVRNMPFASNASIYGSGLVEPLSAMNGTTTGGCLFVLTNGSNTYADLAYNNAGGTAGLTDTAFNNNSQFRFVMTYFI